MKVSRSECKELLANVRAETRYIPKNVSRNYKNGGLNTDKLFATRLHVHITWFKAHRVTRVLPQSLS